MNARDELVRAAGPEFELMCLVAHTGLRLEASPRISNLVDAGIDWGRFLAAVERNCVVPVVQRNLELINGSLIPAKVLDALRARSELIASKNELMAAELARLTPLFAAKSIQTVNYKGAETAEEFYGSVALRSFSDLDFLVRRADLAAVIEILHSEGYRNSEQLTGREFAHYVTEFKEFQFWRGAILLEPHWSLAGRRYPFDTDYEGLWQRSRLLAFRGVDVRVLSREDALLVLCLAGAKGRWKRLQMVTDVAACLHTSTSLDWASIQAMAVATGTVRILQLGLLLAADLADARLPPRLDQTARAAAPVRALARCVVRSLATARTAPRFLPDSPAIFSPLLFRQRERARDRWLYLWRTATTPQLLHARRLPLPRWLSPLYRIFVPLHDFVMYPAFQLGRYLSIGLRRAASSG